MSPLQLLIILGQEDECLLDHISTVDNFRVKTEKDIMTLELLWNRLDVITAPKER